MIYLLLMVYLLESCGGAESSDVAQALKAKHSPEQALNLLNEKLRVHEDSLVFAKPRDMKGVLCIDGHCVSREDFLSAYVTFLRVHPYQDTLTHNDFALLFIEQRIVKDRIAAYQRKYSKELRNLIERQALVYSYVESQSRKSPPSTKNLSQFYSKLVQNKAYRSLDFHKDAERVRSLYFMNRYEEVYKDITDTLKSEYQIRVNDEWEDKLLERYLDNTYDRKALQGGPIFWLYRIRKSPKDIVITIQDIENYVHLLRNLGTFAEAERFQKDSVFKRQFVHRYLLDELLYQKLLDTRLIHSKEYTQIMHAALWNYAYRDYQQKELKLRTLEDYKKHRQEIFEQHKIELSSAFFKGIH